MHMAWMRTVTGRMKSDYMYSVGIVYNTFPTPTNSDWSKLERLARAVLDARAVYPDASPHRSPIGPEKAALFGIKRFE